MNNNVIVGAVLIVVAGLGYYQFSVVPAQKAAQEAVMKVEAAEEAVQKAVEETATKAENDAAAAVTPTEIKDKNPSKFGNFVLITLVLGGGLCLVAIIATGDNGETQKNKLRDAEFQETPYTYAIGRHALETLALRYGIPHLEKDDAGRLSEAKTIRIQKLQLIEKDRYKAKLPDYRDREVVAVIEKGTEYVKTFYPATGNHWFNENGDWETGLKGNIGFTIKDMARMHFDRLNSRL